MPKNPYDPRFERKVTRSPRTVVGQVERTANPFLGVRGFENGAVRYMSHEEDREPPPHPYRRHPYVR